MEFINGISLQGGKINIVSCILYGIDKYKAKRGKWLISGTTLLLMAVIGGSIGAWTGMKV